MFRIALGLSLVFCVACADDPMIAVGPTCEETTCITAPSPICEGLERVVFQAVGICSEDLTEVAVCSYPVAQRESCAAQGDRVCEGGRCVARPPDPVIPCAGVVCNTRPAPACDGTTSVIYRANGTCNSADNSCQYGVEVQLDCSLSGFACRDGGCVDPTLVPCDPNPCDIPPHGTCNGNEPTTVTPIGVCTPVTENNRVHAECEYATRAGSPCSGATSQCYLGQCASGLAAPSQAGDVIFNEIMKNPSVPGDESEWFELYNPTTVAARLEGCVVSDDGGESMTLGQLVVPAKGYVVLGASVDPQPNGGFVPEYHYTGVLLGNVADELNLTCGGVLIDRVQWTELWPSGAGRSMTLGLGDTATVSGNDFLGAWCDAPVRYGDGTNLGSPARANPACPAR